MSGLLGTLLLLFLGQTLYVHVHVMVVIVTWQSTRHVTQGYEKLQLITEIILTEDKNFLCSVKG